MKGSGVASRDIFGANEGGCYHNFKPSDGNEQIGTYASDSQGLNSVELSTFKFIYLFIYVKRGIRTMSATGYARWRQRGDEKRFSPVC